MFRKKFVYFFSSYNQFLLYHKLVTFHLAWCFVSNIYIAKYHVSCADLLVSKLCVLYLCWVYNYMRVYNVHGWQIFISIDSYVCLLCTEVCIPGYTIRTGFISTLAHLFIHKQSTPPTASCRLLANGVGLCEWCGYTRKCGEMRCHTKYYSDKNDLMDFAYSRITMYMVN